MIRTTVRRVLIICGAAVMATAAVATPGSAAPKPGTSSAQPAGPVPGGFASWTDLFAFQDKLNAAATTIIKVGGEGYSSVIADPQTRRLQVYWKGDPPASVRRLTGQLGVPVEFRQAPYTHSQLVAEARRVAADPRVATAAPRADGSGLAVTVTSTVRGTGTADILGTSTMPVTATPGERPRKLVGRQADTPPFKGGSLYGNTTRGGFCSNGFALVVPNAPFVYMLTAAHCGLAGDFVGIPGQPIPTGQFAISTAPRDTAIVFYPQSVAGRVYLGPFNGLGHIGVAGPAVDFIGNIVSTGGSFSGEHNGIQVQAVDQFINIGIVIGPENLGVKLDGTCAAAPGDSGGPVYSLRPDGRVDARGTISAGGNNVACPGLSPVGSNFVWWAPVLRPGPQIGALQFYGVGILPG